MLFKNIDEFIKYCNNNTIKILLAIVENTEDFKGLEGQILVNNLYLYKFRFIYHIKKSAYLGYIRYSEDNVYNWNGDLSEFNMFKEFIISNL